MEASKENVVVMRRNRELEAALADLQAKLAAAERYRCPRNTKKACPQMAHSEARIASLEASLALAEGKAGYVPGAPGKRISALEADVKQYLAERNKYQTAYVEQREEVARLKALHCDACNRSTKGAGFPILPCSPNCEWSPEPSRPPAETCDRCGWPLVADPKDGCTKDNCSMRPLPPKRPPADEFANRCLKYGTPSPNVGCRCVSCRKARLSGRSK